MAQVVDDHRPYAAALVKRDRNADQYDIQRDEQGALGERERGQPAELRMCNLMARREAGE